MPYIPQEDRTKLNVPTNIETVGELNYVISVAMLNYIQTKGGINREQLRSGVLRYQLINDVIGALEGAKLEFYRRLAGPYEDKAIDKNGDIL